MKKKYSYREYQKANLYLGLWILLISAIVTGGYYLYLWWV